VKLERVRRSAWQVTLHPLELAALVSAARWVVDGNQGAPPSDAVDQLRRVLASYDSAVPPEREHGQRP
jgi:hypothetical protein